MLDFLRRANVHEETSKSGTITAVDAADLAGQRVIPVYAIVVFVALAAFWGVRGYARGVEHLGGAAGSDQHLNLLLVLKADDPSLFSRDLVFGDANLIDDYIPAYIGFLRWAYHVFGDLAAGYKVLLFPLTLLYLIGAYFVFRRFSRIAWVAVALAAFSSLPLGVALADEIFGLGPIVLMVARTIITGVFPLCFMAFCSWLDRPGRLVWLFLGLGALANLHPVSALDVAVILGIIYLLERRDDPRRWLGLATMAAAALVGASPIVWSQVRHVARQGAVLAQSDGGAVARVVSERLGFITFPPQSLSALPGWMALGLTLGVMLISIAVVPQGWRREPGSAGLSLRLGAAISVAYLLFPEVKLLSAVPIVLFLLPRRTAGGQEERLAAYFSLAVFWLTMAELLVFQYGPSAINRPLLAVIATRGARFAVFAAYLLIALAVQGVDWTKVRGTLRVACVLLLVFAAFWQARHTFRTYLRPREDVAAADLAAVALWAKDSTKREDLFLFDSAAFRVMARRSLAFATKDGDAVAASRPDRATAWLERRGAMQAAGDDPSRVLAEGERVGAQYVVVPTRALQREVLGPRLRFRNGTYAVLAADGRTPGGGTSESARP